MMLISIQGNSKLFSEKMSGGKGIMPSIKSITHVWITLNHSKKSILRYESYLDA